MFEDKTYEYILNSMLSRVSDSIDKREGSIIYDALAPAAAELAQTYIDLDTVLNIAFIDTTNGEYLDKKGAELALTRKQAVKAQRQVTFTGASPSIGSRFFDGEIYWTVLENGNVEAETAGVIGNSTISGTVLIPVENIPGLTTATIGDIVIPGSDTEIDEKYRDRIIEAINSPQFNSNKAQIKAFCMDIDGIGDAKIFSLWNGANTVKGVLLDSNKIPASSELIDQVQEYIDPNSQGVGEGKADIGVIFTAVAATGVSININVDVSIADGKTLLEAKTEIEEGITEYLKEIAFVESQVKYSQIGAIILNAPSVVDYQNLTINNGTANTVIDDDEVAILGTVVVT